MQNVEMQICNCLYALFGILDKFGQTTGLKLNLDKCTVAPIRCANLNLEHILQNFAGKIVNFPITYLGLPLTLGRLKVAHVQRFVDRTRAKLAGWQGRLLNQAGRRELVRSVLSSMPTYLLSSVKEPKQLTEDIDKIRRRFLWAGSEEITGARCKVAWTTVAKPVDYGGLGIIELNAFSRALRLRWLWYRWSNPDRPWIGTELPVDDTDLAMFNAATVVTVRNGRKASFWNSSWMEGRPPANLFPLLYRHSRRKHRSVRDAIENDKWVRDIAYNLNHDLLNEFFRLWVAIHMAGINLDDQGEDSISWTLESSGEYSARSAYAIQFAGQIQSNHKSLIWKAWAPPKCKFFTWLLLQDRLWTSARLQLRGWENNYFCAICVRNLETAQHLFFECPVTRVVWERVAAWSSCASLSPDYWIPVQDLEDWFVQAIGDGRKKTHSLLILTLWTIWNWRNAIIFRHSRATAEAIFSEIRDTAYQWSLAGCKALKPIPVDHTSSE